MQPGTKELLEQMKTIFEKEGITEYIFFEDRIEGHRQECTPGRDDGSSFTSLNFSKYPSAYVRYRRDREGLFFYKVRESSTYKPDREALKEFYLKACNDMLCYSSARAFWFEHDHLLFLGGKSYSELCEETLKVAFHMLKIPKSHYHFYEEKKFGIVLLKSKFNFSVQYYNSKGNLIYEVRRQNKEDSLWDMYHITYRLVWWERFLKRIKEEGEDIFQLREKDYEKNIN